MQLMMENKQAEEREKRQKKPLTPSPYSEVILSIKSIMDKGLTSTYKPSQIRKSVHECKF